MAETERQRDADGGAQRIGAASGSIAPGALSALLVELARCPDAPAPAPPLPGTVVANRFELVRQVGAGGFGIVYEAHDRELGRSVAFKLVRPGRLERGDEQLGREAEIAARLSHPNLVTLFDVGRCEHGPYLILELLRGETLDRRRARGPMPVREAIRIALEIAKGLGHAHARGVVHRDLKPSNVFLCEDGGVKVLDFGMSHAFGRRRVEGGTPAYMAPEQWRGAPEDERTDVYALGVMLFELLAGEPPFRGEDAGASTRTAPALDVPGAAALGPLVARMLERDPAARARDAADLVTALSSIEADLSRAPQGSSPSRVTKRRVPRRTVTAGAIAGLAVVVAASLAGAALWRGARDAPARVRGIAVLPFVNVSDSAENEYFSDGLTEEVLGTLARVRELNVPGRSQTFYYKGRKVEVAEVGRRLRVDAVLEGSVRRHGDRVRIAAELVDARSGFQLWADAYERTLEDVFAIQGEIARHVVSALEVVLSSASERELRRQPPATPAAYDLYLRARAQLRAPVSAATLDRATELFGEALGADPTFAPAYAGLCETWVARYEMLGRASESFAQAEAACGRARARDPAAGEVHLALGSLHLSSGKPDEAERDFERAYALPGSAVDALLGLAQALAAQRRTDDAERSFEKAAQLDPGYWRVHRLRGHFYFEAGRYAEAARSYAEQVACTPEDPKAHNNLGAARYEGGDLAGAAEAWQRSIALRPSPSAWSNTATSYYYLGRLADAVSAYERAARLAPEDHRVRGNLADAYAHVGGRDGDAAEAYRKAAALAAERLRINPADAGATSDLAHYDAQLGRAEVARRLVAEALRRDPRNAAVHYNAALVSARLGAKDAAVAEIEKAVELGHPRFLLPNDPGLAAIRGEARFGALLPGSHK